MKKEICESCKGTGCIEVKMTFEVVVALSTIINEETLQKKYKGDIHEVCKYLYEQGGYWWDRSKMKLIKTEIIGGDPNNENQKTNQSPDLPA